jgi:SmpA / OmlA family
MKKRMLLVVAVLALTVCAAACVRPGGSITFDQYQKIEVGMTRQQVEETLGGPANGSGLMWAVTSGFGPPPAIPEEWWGPDIIVWVWFNGQDKVEARSFEAHSCGPVKTPNLWEQACSWLPWSRSAAPKSRTALQRGLDRRNVIGGFLSAPN